MKEMDKLNDYMKRISSVFKKKSPAAWRESLLEECQKADDQQLFFQAVIEDLVISKTRLNSKTS